MNVGKWLGCAVLLLGIGGRSLEAASPSEMDAETQYLYEMAKFVRWPGPPADGTLDICVVGRESSLESLKRIVAGESVDGVPMAARAVQKPDERADCDILFLDAHAKNVDALMTAVAGKPILTVSDAPGFLEHGGMLQFTVVDGRVRFSVNLTPVGKSKLGLSSELLKVTASVTGSLGEGGAS